MAAGACPVRVLHRGPITSLRPLKTKRVDSVFPCRAARLMLGRRCRIFRHLIENVRGFLGPQGFRSNIAYREKSPMPSANLGFQLNLGVSTMRPTSGVSLVPDLSRPSRSLPANPTIGDQSTIPRRRSRAEPCRLNELLLRPHFGSAWLGAGSEHWKTQAQGDRPHDCSAAPRNTGGPDLGPTRARPDVETEGWL